MRSNIEPLCSAPPTDGTSARGGTAQVDRIRARLIIPEENNDTEIADLGVSAANTQGRLRLNLGDNDSKGNGANNAETEILIPDDSDTKL
jgi:hypothetical protein